MQRDSRAVRQYEYKIEIVIVYIGFCPIVSHHSALESACMGTSVKGDIHQWRSGTRLDMLAVSVRIRIVHKVN